MNIAILAHDSKKDLMVHFCLAYRGTLAKHNLCSTYTTGKMVRSTTGLKIESYLSGDLGGEQQIAAKISCNEIDLVLFFRDPNRQNDTAFDDSNILKLCDLYNILLATNIATAESMIHSLERGDLDWRNIINKV